MLLQPQGVTRRLLRSSLAFYRFYRELGFWAYGFGWVGFVESLPIGSLWFLFGDYLRILNS